MSNKYLAGTPLIRSGLTPYALAPVHRTQFPELPLEARNKFKKKQFEENQGESKSTTPVLEHIGQNLDVVG